MHKRLRAFYQVFGVAFLCKEGVVDALVHPCTQLVYSCISSSDSFAVVSCLAI